MDNSGCTLHMTLRSVSHTLFLHRWYSFYTGNIDIDRSVETHKRNSLQSWPSWRFCSSCWWVLPCRTSLPHSPEIIMGRVRKYSAYFNWSPTWRRRDTHYTMCVLIPIVFISTDSVTRSIITWKRAWSLQTAPSAAHELHLPAFLCLSTLRGIYSLLYYSFID